MNANELRVGNWVSYFDTVCRIISIKANHLNYVPNSEHYYINAVGVNAAQFYNHIEAFRPIYLTNEIMEAAGFKKGKYSWNMGLVDGYLSHDLVPTGKLLINDDYDEYCFDFPCQYLHQLQNLVFALTGTELEINIHADKQTT